MFNTSLNRDFWWPPIYVFYSLWNVKGPFLIIFRETRCKLFDISEDCFAAIDPKACTGRLVIYYFTTEFHTFTQEISISHLERKKVLYVLFPALVNFIIQFNKFASKHLSSLLLLA